MWGKERRTEIVRQKEWDRTGIQAVFSREILLAYWNIDRYLS